MQYKLFLNLIFSAITKPIKGDPYLKVIKLKVTQSIHFPFLNLNDNARLFNKFCLNLEDKLSI